MPAPFAIAAFLSSFSLLPLAIAIFDIFTLMPISAAMRQPYYAIDAHFSSPLRISPRRR